MYSQKQGESTNKNTPFNCDIETYQHIEINLDVEISLEQLENRPWKVTCMSFLAPNTTFLDCSNNFLGEIQVNILKTLFIQDSTTLTTLSLKHNNLFRKAMFLSAFSSDDLILIAAALREPLRSYCSVVVDDPRGVVEQFLTLSDEALAQLQPLIPSAILTLITSKIPPEEETLIAIFSAIPESVIYLDLSDNALSKADTFILKQAFQSLHRGLRIIELSGNGFNQLPMTIRQEILAALPSDAELIINDDVEPQNATDLIFLDDVTLTDSSLSSQSPRTPPCSPSQAQQSFFPNTTESTGGKKDAGSSSTVSILSGI